MIVEPSQWLDAQIRVTSLLWAAFLVPLGGFLLSILLRFAKRWGAAFVNALLFRASGVLSASLARVFTLKQYCRLSLEQASKYLHVPSRHDIRLEIDQMLVPLTLTEGTADGVLAQRDILAVGKRLILVGDPGAGKSSLAKWLFREECRRAASHARSARFPLLFELKNITKPLGKSGLFGLLRDSVSPINAFMVSDGLDAFARSTGVLIILDGLDEVASNRYVGVQKEITRLSAQLTALGTNNVLILTMRTQFYAQVRDAYRDAFAATLGLRPFSDGDIYDFLCRWPFGRGQSGEVNRIFGELSERPSLKEMCRNPLVLSMYVAEDQAGGNVVPPDSRTEFYGKVVEELILRRRLVQLEQRPVAPMKLREQREMILGKLSFEHLLDPAQPANMLSFDRAVSIVREVSGLADGEIERLRELCRETGLLTEERYGQSLRFMHLTFCEYFAAHYAVVFAEHGWQMLVRRHRDFQNSPASQEKSRLREVIAFASGLLPLAQQVGALREIEALQDDKLLLTCLLETKRYESEIWPAVAGRCATRFAEMSPDDVGKQWIGDFHFFGVVLRDAEACREHFPGIVVDVAINEIFEIMLRRAPDTLRRLVSAYAIQDAAAAFRLAEAYGRSILRDFPDLVVRHCDQRPFFEFVRERAVLQDPDVGWPLLLAEAGLRFRSTARWLTASDPVESLARLLDNTPRSRQWPSFSGDNLFRQCLTYAGLKPPAAGLPGLLSGIRFPVMPLAGIGSVVFVLFYAYIVVDAFGGDFNLVLLRIAALGTSLAFVIGMVGFAQNLAVTYAIVAILGRGRLADLISIRRNDSRRSMLVSVLTDFALWPMTSRKRLVGAYWRSRRVRRLFPRHNYLLDLASRVEVERDGFVAYEGRGWPEDSYLR